MLSLIFEDFDEDEEIEKNLDLDLLKAFYISNNRGYNFENQTSMTDFIENDLHKAFFSSNKTSNDWKLINEFGINCQQWLKSKLKMELSEDNINHILKNELDDEIFQDFKNSKNRKILIYSLIEKFKNKNFTKNVKMIFLIYRMMIKKKKFFF